MDPKQRRWLPTAIPLAPNRNIQWLPHLRILTDDLHSKGIALRVLTGTLAGVYTPHGEGKFFFTVMAAFAELERDLIQQRTVAGLEAARRRGRVGGRPTVMSPDRLAAALARRERGESPSEIAKALGISRATYYRHINRGSAAGA